MRDAKRFAVWFALLAIVVIAGDRIGAFVCSRVLLGSQFRFSRVYRGGSNADVLVIGDSRGVHSFYAAPTAGQLAGTRALGGAAAWVAEARAEYQSTGSAAARRLGLPPPEGGTFLFFDVANHLDDRGLDGFLARCADRGILLAPGTSFGPYPTWVRLCFTAVDPARSLRGIEVLAGLLG